MIARFISLMAVAVADNEGLHHLNEAAAISLLQTSSSKKISGPCIGGPARCGPSAGGPPADSGPGGPPADSGPGGPPADSGPGGPPADSGPGPNGGGGGGSCKAAKAALKTARQAKGTACEDEPTDYVEPPEGMTPLDKYKIFPPPEEDDPSALKSCKEGWMAHTTQMWQQRQCWYKAVSEGAFDEIKGPLGTYRVSQSESNHITPSACIELVWKISRQTGLCNPNATSRRLNLPANYRFTGCTAEFWDQSSSDVLTVPDHLVEDQGMFNNLRGQTKYGSCMLCGQGLLGDGNRVYGVAEKQWVKPGLGNRKVTTGMAGLIRRDSFAPITRMSCILNPEEKDGFEIAQMK